MERDKEFINVACLSHDAWTSTWCSSLNSAEGSFVLNVVWSSWSLTNIICCALMIEANCICIFVHNISSGLISFILSIISSVSSGKYFANKPCFILFLFFLVGPVDLPPCIRQRPFAIAPFLHGVPALVLAPHNFRPFFA